MPIRFYGLMTAAAALTALACAGPAQAVTMQECSAKYKAAQAAGSVAGKSWNEFRKAECGRAAIAPAAGPAPAKVARPAKQAAASALTPVFPTGIAPKFAALPPGEARRETCSAQYQANKINNSNGGLTWSFKGGGYYSECNKRLAQQ